jgi:hypothetical protein
VAATERQGVAAALRDPAVPLFSVAVKVTVDDIRLVCVEPVYTMVHYTRNERETTYDDDDENENENENDDKDDNEAKTVKHDKAAADVDDDTGGGGGGDGCGGGGDFGFSTSYVDERTLLRINDDGACRGDTLRILHFLSDNGYRLTRITDLYVVRRHPFFCFVKCTLCNCSHVTRPFCVAPYT